MVHSICNRSPLPRDGIGIFLCKMSVLCSRNDARFRLPVYSFGSIDATCPGHMAVTRVL